MRAVILIEFPSDQTRARSWILDHAAKLAIEGKAELKFIGTERARSGGVGAETIALEFGSTDIAHSTLSAWRENTGLPGVVEMRLLQTEAVTLTDAIFP